MLFFGFRPGLVAFLAVHDAKMFSEKDFVQWLCKAFALNMWAPQFCDGRFAL
jgi:hypothetical protein